jgi:hypothetical protein
VAVEVERLDAVVSHRGDRPSVASKSPRRRVWPGVEHQPDARHQAATDTRWRRRR